MAFAVTSYVTKTAAAPTKQIPQVIQKPTCDPVLNPKQSKNDCYYKLPQWTTGATNPSPGGASGTHSIRATTRISEEALRLYLLSKKSPLAPFSAQLLQSPYWSTIIGITYVEQSFYKLPGGTNWNLYGIMGCKGLCYYATAEEGITAINGFLGKAERNGRDTIEEFRGWYCYATYTVSHVCPGWEAGVLKVKTEIEAL